MTRRTRLSPATLSAIVLALGGVAARSQDEPVPRPAARGEAESPPAATAKPAAPKPAAKKAAAKLPKVAKPDRFWRANLQPNQYLVTRRKATEPAFGGIYWNHHDDGVYACVCCGTPQFDSRTKFDSGTGWPSYWRAIDKDLLKAKPDLTNGQPRTEVVCRVCDAHLGHVFNDGPRPTGLRFCINSASLHFVARTELPDHLEAWRKFVGLAPAEDETTKGADEAKATEAAKPGAAAEAGGEPKAGEPGPDPEPKRVTR